jgi:hypothetical protein
MRKFVILTLPAVAALAVAAPAGAQHKAAPATRPYHRSALEAALSARLQSIQTRIELLRQEGLMGSEEALNLQQESRSIEQRLIGLNARDVSDVELALGRLHDRVRFADENARSGSHVYDRTEVDRYEDRHPLAMSTDRYFDQLDRHVAPSVDRWDDPFDRGNEF